MKLIIDINEKYIKTVQYRKPLSLSAISEAEKAISVGTPLPKGHGRLIDADEFISDIKKHYFDNETVIRCVEIALDNASTIIEADTESEIRNETDN